MSPSVALLLAAAFVQPLERVATLDPIKAVAVTDSKAVGMLYATLLDVDYAARPYRLVPGLSELPEVSADRLEYVFRLRDERVTAAEAAASLERLRDPKLLSPNAWMLRRVDTIVALDAHTLKITLASPCHFFPWLLAMTSAGIRHADGSGTGEFTLQSWRRNHELVFARPPAAGAVSEVRYLEVSDMFTRWLMLLKGEVDLLAEVPRDYRDAVLDERGELRAEYAARGLRAYTSPTLSTFYLGINQRDPVLGTNRKLRQALNAGFDFPRWREYQHGAVDPASGPLPPQVEGRLETPFSYAFDLQRAQQLLAEAGYPGGIDPATGRRLELTLTIGRATQDSRESGELLASFYAALGINLHLEFMTWDAFLKAVGEFRTQLFLMGWVGDYPDAENYLQLFHSSNLSPGPNHTGYSNPDYDREYDLAMAAATAEERNEHWRRCQELLREDCPWVFLHHPRECTLVNARIGNFVPGGMTRARERFFTVTNGESKP